MIDTNVLGEARKEGKANGGVTRFFHGVEADGLPIYISSVSIGELRRGVEAVWHQRNVEQAGRLEDWLDGVLAQFWEHILPFDLDAAQVWGRLMVPRPEHAFDKQIAAIALVNDLTVVTRNTADFDSTGVRLLNPFSTT